MILKLQFIKKYYQVFINYKHFLNITRIANLIPGKEATLKDYFKDYCKNNDPKELKNLD